MNSPNIPEPEHTLAILNPLIPHLFHALELGVQEARNFFDEKKQRPDPYLFPCLVRYHAKMVLQGKEQTVEYDCDDLANNGLALVFGGHPIRILKSDDGRLPVPGLSRIKQEFYCQQLSFAFMSSNREPSEGRVNLVVLWETDGLWNLGKLTLVCPKAGGLTRESVEQHWEIQLPHPALLVKAETVQSVIEDLPLSLKQSDQGKVRQNG